MEIKDKKGTENLVAGHLSRLEGPCKEVQINDDFFITTQKVLFYTFDTLCFEHFLYSNWPNEPSWHVKDLEMLLIKFYSMFGCFLGLYISRTRIQVKA